MLNLIQTEKHLFNESLEEIKVRFKNNTIKDGSLKSFSPVLRLSQTNSNYQYLTVQEENKFEIRKRRTGTLFSGYNSQFIRYRGTFEETSHGTLVKITTGIQKMTLGIMVIETVIYFSAIIYMLFFDYESFIELTGIFGLIGFGVIGMWIFILVHLSMGQDNLRNVINDIFRKTGYNTK